MKKLKLNLASLTVESFDAVAPPNVRRDGTVRGASGTDDFACETGGFTCETECYDTEAECGSTTIPSTYGNTNHDWSCIYCPSRNCASAGVC